MTAQCFQVKHFKGLIAIFITILLLLLQNSICSPFLTLQYTVQLNKSAKSLIVVHMFCLACSVF